MPTTLSNPAQRQSVQLPRSIPPLGAFPRSEGTVFRTYATTARDVEVRIARVGAAAVPMAPTGAAGVYETFVPDVGAGARYMLALDGRELPDPYARWLPDGVHGPAAVVDPQHRWQNGCVGRPLREQSIYELHVGTFTAEGTFEAARARLKELAALGVTAIQLMPLSAFAGRWGWGYDGVAPFAPFAGYGAPDQLRELVDEAHGLGLSVFLDVVYNHFGPAGNYLSLFSPDYFTKDVRTPWGDAVNFSSPVVRRLVIDNALYWLQEFRFDGLRLDATHAIIDPSPQHILQELAAAVRTLTPGRLLIAEDERNEPAVVLQVGLDGLWADDFHHQVRVTMTGERDGYYGAYDPGVAGVARAIEHGWLYEGDMNKTTGKPRGAPATLLDAESFVYCLENHDQVGNRALGDRLSDRVSLDAYCAASTLLLVLPMTPLIFMGQEWAACTPFQYFTDHEPELGRLISQGRREEFKSFEAFDSAEERAGIPDPQAETTFTGSRLRWEEREEGGHARVLDLYRRLLHLRRTDPVLRAVTREGLAAQQVTTGLLQVTMTHGRQRRVLLVNFGDTPAPSTLLLGTSSGEAPRLLFRSDGGAALPVAIPPAVALLLEPAAGAAGDDLPSGAVS